MKHSFWGVEFWVARLEPLCFLVDDVRPEEIHDAPVEVHAASYLKILHSHMYEFSTY